MFQANCSPVTCTTSAWSGGMLSTRAAHIGIANPNSSTPRPRRRRPRPRSSCALDAPCTAPPGGRGGGSAPACRAKKAPQPMNRMNINRWIQLVTLSMSAACAEAATEAEPVQSCSRRSRSSEQSVSTGRRRRGRFGRRRRRSTEPTNPPCTASVMTEQEDDDSLAALDHGSSAPTPGRRCRRAGRSNIASPQPGHHEHHLPRLAQEPDS